MIGDTAGIEAPVARRALIVEDDERLRSSLVRAVRRWNAEILEARDVGEAIALLEREPDLVVMDVQLPDGTGCEVARRAAAMSPPPLMVAMSGTASAAEAFELASLGVRAYLPKPFELDEFMDEVRNAAQGSSQDARPELRDVRGAVLRRLEGHARRHGLTAREQEVARLAVEGVPRARFSNALGVSENTCKTLVRRALTKCGAKRLADIPRMLLAEDPHDA